MGRGGYHNAVDFLRCEVSDSERAGEHTEPPVVEHRPNSDSKIDEPDRTWDHWGDTRLDAVVAYMMAGDWTALAAGIALDTALVVGVDHTRADMGDS